MIVEPQVQWTTPAPLWPGLADPSDSQRRDLFRQPAILRFNTDSFMEEFLALLNNEPGRLGEWQAQPETWRGPATTPQLIVQLPAFARSLNRLRLAQALPTATVPATTAENVLLPGSNLKLYQPAHQRFYLITACLVCRIPGLPDRLLDSGNQERATFVVRRLRPKQPGPLPAEFNLTTCDEYALITAPRGQRWQKAAAATALVPDEEQLPLFGVTYGENDGRQRRLLAGVIPAGKREVYIGATASFLDPAEAPDPMDPRKTLLLSQVTDPWRSLLKLQTQTTERVQASRAAMQAEGLSEAEITAAGLSQTNIDNNQTPEQLATADQIQMLSWYILLDFADYLAKYLPNVWKVITGETLLGNLMATESILFNALTGATSGVETLVTALAKVVDERTILEQATTTYPSSSTDWPNWRFALTDADELMGEDGLETLVQNAWPVTPPPATPPLPLAAQQSALDLREPGWFVIRCVFERPNCGPLFPVVLSEATQPFQLASFFDPDAPARPIRIPLPLDTTIAGLRKFDKNTAFMISDALCGQMNRMGTMTFGDLVLSVLPWPFHKDLPAPDTGPCTDEDDPSLNIGMICSFSIPIITICALILLMIIVNLLDLIFRWVPFFIACFPLPGFKAKES